MALLRPSERRGQRSLFRLALILAAALTAGLAAMDARAQPVASEDQVKAAYLLNFARFVEWPADVLPASAPLNIAVVGDDPFGEALEQQLRGKSANGHPIELRHQRWDDVLTPYQIVFISTSEEGHLQQILGYLRNASVLTVSDIDRFAMRGGVLEFRTVGNCVRFDINRSNGVSARLLISSKLLSVARSVYEGSTPR